MSKYIVSTYERIDNGEDGASFGLLRHEGAFKTLEGAKKLALAMANHDGALHAFLKAADGFAVVIHKEKNPVAVFEHDGIRLNEWYGDDIAEQLFE